MKKQHIYFITMRARKKNGKRHIVYKYCDLSIAKKTLFSVNIESCKKYEYALYDGKWDLVCFLTSDKREGILDSDPEYLGTKTWR